LKFNWHFGGTCHIHFQGQKLKQRIRQQEDLSLVIELFDTICCENFKSYVRTSGCEEWLYKGKAIPNKPWRPIGFWDVEVPTFSRRVGSQIAVRLWALCAGRPLPPGRFLVLISVIGWIDSMATVRLEGLGQLTNPITSSRIKTLDLPLKGTLGRHWSWWEDNIKMGLRNWKWCELDSSGSGQGSVAGSCKQGNECPQNVGNFLNGCWLLKKGTAPWSYGVEL
jgi:hypothetical protein